MSIIGIGAIMVTPIISSVNGQVRGWEASLSESEAAALLGYTPLHRGEAMYKIRRYDDLRITEVIWLVRKDKRSRWRLAGSKNL